MCVLVRNLLKAQEGEEEELGGVKNVAAVVVAENVVVRLLSLSPARPDLIKCLIALNTAEEGCQG